MTEQVALQAGKRTHNVPQTLDGSTLRPIPTPRMNLKHLGGVRVEMAKVYRAMKSGEIEGQEGSRRAYVLSLIGKIIEADELAQRIEALEEQISRR